MKITTTWPALFQYASEAGKARIKYKENPTSENKKLLDKAIKEHDDYRDLCLEADNMIGLPNIYE